MYRKILALLMCVAIFCLAGCNKAETNDSQETNKPADQKQEVVYANNLTGEENIKEKDVYQKRPVAVMVNNISVAQKVQTGLAEADIVYETEVEGGITRLMAVFKDISKVEKIGTVRSARYAYIDLAMGHDAIYVHHGQDKTYAKPHLKDTQTFILGTNNAGERAKNGLATEHTLYGYGAKIWKWFEKKDYNIELDEVENWQNFAPKDKEVAYPEQVAEMVTVKFSSAYVSEFKYDSESGKYVRYFRGEKRKDYYTGESELFKNVFVLATDIEYYPDNKHKKVDLSKGSGFYCVNGTYTSIKWEKGDASDSLKFTLEDGTPLEVNRGNSWVCFHAKGFDPKFEQFEENAQ